LVRIHLPLPQKPFSEAEGFFILSPDASLLAGWGENKKYFARYSRAKVSVVKPYLKGSTSVNPSPATKESLGKCWGFLFSTSRKFAYKAKRKIKKIISGSDLFFLSSSSIEDQRAIAS
jgi:hypothetical protein